MKDERKHSIDKLFNESLSGHKIEPTKSVWASLSSHVPSTSGGNMLMFLVSAVAIGVLSLFLNTSIISDKLMPETAAEISNTSASHTEITAGGEEQSSKDPVSKAINSETEAVPVNENTNDNIKTPEATDLRSTLPSTEAIEKAEHPDEKSSDEKAQAAEISSPEYEKLDLLEYRIALIEFDEPIEMEFGETRTFKDPVFDLSIKDGYTKKADLLFGAGVSPAVNIYPDGQNRNDYSLELTAAYEKSRFIMEGGLGANYTSESAKYGITYSTFDSIGYFVNVNSFSIDPQNPDSILFETSLKSIYDSIEHYRIEENTNKYAYLQIPVRMGYRIIEKDRFSLDMKLGILFSIQIYKDVPEAPYQGNDVDEIEVIRHYPDRLRSNWQYSASLGMNYHINRQLRFTLEPFYRQYIKSVYSSTSEYSARSPYAFGIRGGIYFHF
ncbi:MAG: hypothetical protein ABFS05_00470 [Bacteroidota bacterium]